MSWFIYARKETYPAQNAIVFTAELAGELVHVVLVDTPAAAVWSLTVKAVICAAFGDPQAELKEMQVFLVTQKLRLQRNGSQNDNIG